MATFAAVIGLLSFFFLAILADAIMVNKLPKTKKKAVKKAKK